jgi:S1-C subfamily serine protease
VVVEIKAFSKNLLVLLVIVCVLAPPCFPQAIKQGSPPVSTQIRLIKSTCGPTVEVTGDTVKFSEVRSKFRVPMDNQVAIHFEWEGPPGPKNLQGLWKQPDGKVQSISDIQMENKGNRFQAFWTFRLVEVMPSGVWELEVRIDGQAAGSHLFQVEVTAPAPAVVPPTPAPVKKVEQPSMEEIYSLQKSVVSVHGLSADGRKLDTCSGFVVSKIGVMTAYQCIDGAAKARVEFADGHAVETDQIAAYHRKNDWVTLKLETRAPTLTLETETRPKIGDNLALFQVSADNSRRLEGADITGRKTQPGYGERWLLNTTISSSSVGGPLLNRNGRVVGMIAGSLTPGLRATNKSGLQLGTGLFFAVGGDQLTLPITEMAANTQGSDVTFADLKAGGQMLPPLVENPNLFYVALAKTANFEVEAFPQDYSSFSKSDPNVYVFLAWLKREKTKKDSVFYISVFDALGRSRSTSTPAKLKLPASGQVRSSLAIATNNLEPGIYQVQVHVNSDVVWRGFFLLER